MVGTREQRQRAPHVGVRNRVAVAVEAHVGRLAGDDGAHHVGLEGMRGQRQEPRLLLGQHVGDGPIALLGMGTLMRDLVAPAPKLRVQIVDIDKRARRKEGVAQVLDLALDLPLLIGAARRARPRRKVIVPGELEQPRVKPNRGAGALEDGTAQVVVDQGPRDARPRLEGLDMAAQKTLERLIDREEREDGARVREHHHKAGQRPHAAADADRAKRAPIDLRLFGSQGGEAAIHAWPSPPGGSGGRRAAAARPSPCSRGPCTISKSRVARRRGYCASVSRMKGR